MWRFDVLFIIRLNKLLNKHLSFQLTYDAIALI